MTLSLVSRRAPHLPPLSFRCFPHGQRGHVPVVMETRANRDGNSAGTLSSLSLSLRTISFASSPSFSFCLSLSTSSLFVLRPPSHPNTPIYVPTYSRPTLSVVSKLSLAPSCSFLPTRLARRSLYPLSSVSDRPRRGALLFFHPLSLAPSPSSRPVSLV